LKEICRGRGISRSGHALYRPNQRSNWLVNICDETCFRAASLLGRIEAISQLRRQAGQRLIAYERGRADYRALIKLPGLGQSAWCRWLPLSARCILSYHAAVLALLGRHPVKRRLLVLRRKDCQTAEKGLEART